ncbi:hypothetical protein [Advenella incenata]|uniref:hypothetical protein n=1 Tax=Advenella incenata TaxID=267800 RepID=UPI0010295F37|nr:hypothetical protein [Advenella incenata]
MMTEGKESPDGENSTYNDVSKLTIFIFYENIITFYAALYHFFRQFCCAKQYEPQCGPAGLVHEPIFRRANMRHHFIIMVIYRSPLAGMVKTEHSADKGLPAPILLSR